LWGNDESVLAVVRSPWSVSQLLQKAGLRCPRVWRRADGVSPPTRCLVKPLASAGGSQIHFWTGAGPLPAPKRTYFQEYIEGDPWAAAFVGDGHNARLLGVTRQLVGESWLHAAPFHYCGSVGLLPLTSGARQALESMGNVLVSASGMRGLFGLDCIARDGVPWPVEINPRYTASMEVVECALGLPVLALHRQVFDPHAPALTEGSPAPSPWVGKAVWFAPAEFIFPDDGPWQSALRDRRPWEVLPAFADIPTPGQRIAPGWPVLTFFAQADSPDRCLNALRQIAAALDRWLVGR
jgi:predicted ATP-grasp superfamily ATP-dependent carboligase